MLQNGLQVTLGQNMALLIEKTAKNEMRFISSGRLFYKINS